MKVLRIGAIVFGGLLLIVLVVAGIAIASFDQAKLATELTRVVKEKKQRTLRIDGAVDLSVFPRLGVKLGGLSLSEHASEVPFASVGSARVAVQLLPLLTKTLVVDRIDIEGAKARLVRRQDGTLNIADLLAEDKEPSPLLKFDIAGIHIADSRLEWHDEISGQKLALSDFNLDTGRIANAAQGKLEMSTRLAAAQPKSDLAVDLAGRYDYDLESRRVGIDGLEAQVKGALTGWQGLEIAADVGHLSLNPARNELRLEKLRLAAKGGKAQDRFDATLDAPSLALMAGKSGGDSVTLKATLSGPERKLDAKLTLLGIEGSSAHLKAGKLAVDVDGKLGDTTLKGGLATPLSASLDALSFELPKLAGSFDIGSPKMPVKQLRLPIAGELRADLRQRTAEGELATRFDESQVQARFNVARFTPLTLGFQVAVDKFNADRYLPAAEQRSPPSGKSGGKARQRIDLSALKDVRLTGHVSIGSLQAKNIKASNVELDVKAADGRLDIAPHSARLYEGTVTGSLRVDANRNTYALRENLTGVKIGALLKDAAGEDLLEGRGNVALDLQTRGDSVAAMKGALGGSARVLLKDGALKGINLAQSLRGIKARLSGGQDVVQQARATESTDFSELSASFAIANGVAHNDDLSLKSPFLRLSGSGDIDLARGTMNYLAKTSVVASTAGQGGKELEALKGLTVPVRISGPLASLSYRLEVGGLVQDAARTKIQETQQQLKQKTEDKLKEKLKGLLGR